jgi:hypothetical protein
MSDLLAIQETNPDNLKSSGLINFQKRILISHVIHDLASYRMVPYNFKTILDLHQVLINLHIPFTQDDLKKLSLKCEGSSKDKSSILKFITTMKEPRKYSGISSGKNSGTSTPDLSTSPSESFMFKSKPKPSTPVVPQSKSPLNPSSPRKKDVKDVSKEQLKDQLKETLKDLSKTNPTTQQPKKTTVNKYEPQNVSTDSPRSKSELDSMTQIFSKNEILESKQNLRKLVNNQTMNSKSFKQFGKLEKSDFEKPLLTSEMKKNPFHLKSKDEFNSNRKSSSHDELPKPNTKSSPINDHKRMTTITVLKPKEVVVKEENESIVSFNRRKFEAQDPTNFDQVEREKETLIKKKNRRNSWDEISSEKTKSRKSMAFEESLFSGNNNFF